MSKPFKLRSGSSPLRQTPTGANLVKNFAINKTIMHGTGTTALAPIAALISVKNIKEWMHEHPEWTPDWKNRSDSWKDHTSLGGEDNRPEFLKGSWEKGKDKKQITETKSKVLPGQSYDLM